MKTAQEQWQRISEKDAAAREEAADIQAALDRGGVTIKANHRVKGLNPEGEETFVQFSDGQVARRQGEIEKLQKYIVAI